jgi:hypothetical protein
MATSLICWNCGDSLADVPLPVSRHANCASCFEVLHCCRMCRHYTPNKSPYCDDERSDPPSVKENANFCEYFEPANRFNARDAGPSVKATSELDNLFGGTDNQPASGSEHNDVDKDDPLNKFNGLFDD